MPRGFDAILRLWNVQCGGNFFYQRQISMLCQKLSIRTVYRQPAATSGVEQTTDEFNLNASTVTVT
jgi:hypothetical protein